MPHPDLSKDPHAATAPVPELRVHASALIKEGRGVLLRGPSGAGKSDTALRLIDRGFQLVGDDQIWLSRVGNGLQAEPDQRLAGVLEVRGMGLWPVPYVAQAPIMLVVDLLLPPYRQTPSGQTPSAEHTTPKDTGSTHVPRLPDVTRIELLGASLPYVQLYAFEDSSLIKIEWALAQPEKIGGNQLLAK